MDITNTEYTDCLCRTCMHELTEAHAENNKSEQKWKFIFDAIAECGALSIAQLLSSTIRQIDVQINDELPKKICCDCLQKLLRAYHFQQMCLKSEQQMRALIVKRNADLKMAIAEPSIDDEISTNKCSIQEPHLEARDQRFEFESVKNLPDAPQKTATDPLQSIEQCENSQVDGSSNVKNEESDDDESRVECYYGETLLSTVSVKNDIMTVTTEEEPLSLSSSTHTCPLCNKSFNEHHSLKSHLKRHKKMDVQKAMDVQSKKKIKDFPFKCDICNRYFHKPESLHKHRLLHDEKTDSKLPREACDMCEKTYGSRRTLAEHKKLQHSAEKPQKTLKRFSCEFCDKTLQSSGALRIHVRSHTGERPYLCAECGKSYSTEGNLKNHRLRHRDDKPFECPYCPRRFHCSSDITNHKLIHEKIKPHICDVCGSAFSQAYQLRKHKKNHNGEKPYKCEYCEMRFSRMTHQRCHMRTHTGEKPYKCKYCERAFAQSGDHIKHLRTHLGNDVYRCELCPLAFRLASEMRLHFATHKHDDEGTRERNMKALKEEEAKMLLKLAAKNIKSADLDINEFNAS